MLKSENVWSDLKNSNGFGILDPKNRKCVQKDRGRNQNKKVKNWGNSGGGRVWKEMEGGDQIKKIPTDFESLTTKTLIWLFLG